VCSGININDITIYEDDSSVDIEEYEERTKTLREEAIKEATNLGKVYELCKKGTSKGGD